MSPLPEPFASGDPLREVFAESDSGTRGRIITEAVPLLASGGVSRTRISDLAKAAQVTPPTVHRLFGPKETVERIYDAVVKRCLRELRAVVTVATHGMKPTEDLFWQAATSAFVKYFDTNRQMASVFFGPEENPRTRACPILRDTVFPYIGGLLEQRYGRDRLKRPLVVARQLGCSLLQLMHAYVHQIEDLSQEEVIDLIMLAPAVPAVTHGRAP
jgi:AcrR family transcriptional regulator